MLLSWVLECVIFCVSSLRVESLFSTALWISQNKPCWQSAFTPSPAPAQVSLGSASLSYTCCFRGHAFPLSLQLSPPPPLSSSPLACDSQSPTHTSVPPPTHARTHTRLWRWGQERGGEGAAYLGRMTKWAEKGRCLGAGRVAWVSIQPQISGVSRG